MTEHPTSEHVARLREFEAPPEIAAWASRYDSFDTAWDESPSSRHRIWLAAISGVAVETIAEAAAAAFFVVGENHPELEHLTRAVEESVGATDAETAANSAERCEREAHPRSDYREHDRTRAAMLAKSAAQVCRAFEALRAAESSLESDRLTRASTMASYMGGGTHAFLPAAPGPATLLTTLPSRVERGLLILAVAASAEAVNIVAASADDTMLIDDAVWDMLTPE